MVPVSNLYRDAEKSRIRVYTYPLPRCGSVALNPAGDICCIGMDKTICDGSTQERTHLAHELGHCKTGSFYTILFPADLRERRENRADKWAIRRLIPKAALDNAVALGCTEIWQLAEHFGVTEAFMRKAVCLYVHGNISAELYF